MSKKNKKLLISFSGAQSTGKTTLLKTLKKFNDHINFVPEVTRLIKRDYGVEINEDGNEMTQSLIITEHFKNIHKHNQRFRSTILDRCILDGLVYTLWLEDNKQLQTWCADYADYVLYTHIKHYDVIFYTNPADVEIVNDGERSVDEKFREDIIDLFNKFVNIDEQAIPLLKDKIVLLKGTIEERLQTIKETLAKKGLDINIQ